MEKNYSKLLLRKMALLRNFEGLYQEALTLSSDVKAHMSDVLPSSTSSHADLLSFIGDFDKVMRIALALMYAKNPEDKEIAYMMMQDIKLNHIMNENERPKREVR